MQKGRAKIIQRLAHLWSNSRLPQSDASTPARVAFGLAYCCIAARRVGCMRRFTARILSRVRHLADLLLLETDLEHDGRNYGLADMWRVAHALAVVVGVLLRDGARCHKPFEVFLHVVQARIHRLHVQNAETVRLKHHILHVVTRQQQRVRNARRMRVGELAHRGVGDGAANGGGTHIARQACVGAVVALLEHAETTWPQHTHHFVDRLRRVQRVDQQP
mmetsp:Transcript_70434/g.177550  ORF Transcript_70434/g.177550 Transcript_70434/m.177550 type:complete len:219 (-) Transcript_70434:426-1082(-)